MATNLAHSTGSAPVLSSENSVVIAKAALRSAEKSEINPVWVKHGAAMREVMRFHDLSLEEFAFALKKDSRQIARQMEGKERPQIEVVLGVQKYEGPMLIAMARRTDGVEIDTVLHIRSSR